MTLPRQSSVSLCMIVRNEAHQLDDCLAPVADVFDDIVVVDTGSQDNTPQVAERYTPRVVSFAWRDDFSAARNESLRHARGNWIFWLDADDRLAPPEVEKLRALVAQLADEPQAFVMETVLHQDQQARDRERLTSHLRLFRRHAALSWRRRVHEALGPWPTALGYEVVFSDIRIDHLGYNDFELTQRKLRRNVRLLQMDFAISPDDPCVLMDLGAAQAQLGNAAEARRLLSAVLEQGLRCPLIVQRAYTTLGELETALGNFDAAARLLQQALQAFPGDEYLLYMRSEALFNLGRYPEAKGALMEILRQTPENGRFQVGVPSDTRRRLVPLALAEVLRAQNALRDAEEVLLGVAKDFPTDPSVWFFLGRVYIDWCRWSKLDEAMARLSECSNGRFFAALLRAWRQIVQSQWLAAEETLASLIPQAPSMTLLRMLRAECLHRRNAPAVAQKQACGEVLRLQPQNSRAQEILRSAEEGGRVLQGTDAAALCTSVMAGMGVPMALA